MDKCAVFVANYRGLDCIIIIKNRGEEIFAGGKFREIPFAVDNIFAGGKFRAKSKFANIAKISSTRKIGFIGPTVDIDSVWVALAIYLCFIIDRL